MHTVKLNLKQGFVLINAEPIAVDEKGVLVKQIARLCSPPIQTNDGRTQFRLVNKVSIFGKSADCAIEVGEKSLHAVTFLFDFIEFFESSILESKILKKCEKILNVKFISDHPSTAFLEDCKWGQAVFFYDAKQGDLSLDITFEPESTKPIYSPGV